MKQNLITLPRTPRLVSVLDVDGDLQVVGWERKEAFAKTDGHFVELHLEDDTLSVSCDGALILYMPGQSDLNVNSVARDVDLRAVTGNVRIENIGGDAQIRNTGKAMLNNVARDLNVRNLLGDFVCNNVGDDASIRQVQGAVSLGNVGADLYLREVVGNVGATVGADAVLYWQPQSGCTCQVTAGGDILLRVDGDADAAFDVQGGGPESIRIDLPGFVPGDDAAQRVFTLGSGAASVRLIAGGDVVVTSRADEWESKIEFDTFARYLEFDPGRIAERASQIAEEVTRRAMRHAQRAESQSERVQRKVEAALRRAEEKIRAAERRSMHMGFSFGRASDEAPRPPVPPRPPAPPSDPVSDEERLVILRMLQEKKITLSEAEKLLAALEGK